MTMKFKHQRTEYPRPHFARKNWQTLNGEWDFRFDDEEKGEINEYFRDFAAERKINVPFSYQAEASGIGIKEMHEVMWYKRTFKLSETLQKICSAVFQRRGLRGGSLAER